MASNPGRVPAGGREKISVVVNTSNRGGTFVRKSFLVRTNDPKTPQTNLKVSAKVKAFIDVLPRYVRLMGPNGENLTQTVKITPQKNYPFTIKSVSAKEGDNIRFDLKPVGKHPENDGYKLVVTNTRRDAGYYRDFIIIETDLKQKSTLRIPVSGRIFGEDVGKGAGKSGGTQKN